MRIFLSWIMIVVCWAVAGAQGPAGSWSGVLEVAPQARLRLVFNFEETGEGTYKFTLDSPDQDAKGIPGEVNILTADSVNVMVRNIALSYAGSIKGDTIRGTFTQGGMKLPLTLTKTGNDNIRPQTPQPPFPYIARDVSFVNPSANAVLSGTLLLPDNYTEETPVVIMITGSGVQNRDEEAFGHRPFLVIADHLARHGIATLRYDDRGFGKSTGDSSQATTKDFADDAASGILFLRKELGLRNVGILGHSEGGSIAFMLAGDKRYSEQTKPRFVITLGAPAMKGDSILAGQNEALLQSLGVPTDLAGQYADALIKLYGIKLSQGSEAAFGSIDKITVAWPDNITTAKLKENLRQIAFTESPWLDYFVSYSPAGDIAATKSPALALYGSKDTQVLPVNAEALREINPNIDVRVLEGLNHLMQTAQTGLPTEYGNISETVSPQALEAIATFINSLSLSSPL